jgi:hypothetical protein
VTLADWLKIGWLREHAPDATEVRQLLAVATRDLKDATSPQLSVDWRFGIAYNAALQLARAALLASGFDTPKGDSHHYRALDSLQWTVGLDSPRIAMLQNFRKKRSAGVYEAVGTITQSDAEEMLDTARQLDKLVRGHLRSNHPAWFKAP